MKPRDLLAIVLIGTSLIVAAPTSKYAGQVGNVTAQDVKVMPRQAEAARAEQRPASFAADKRGFKKLPAADVSHGPLP